MQRKFAHCCSVCFVPLVCGWCQQEKKRFSRLLGFVELRLSPPQRLPLGIPIKSKNRKRARGRWEEGKGGSRPLFSLPIVPRALSFSLSLALPTIKRGEASVGERREELWREFFDKLGTVNNKSFETSSTRIWISLKRRFFFSVFEKIWVHQALESFSLIHHSRPHSQSANSSFQDPVTKKRGALETRIGILSNDDDYDGENVSLKVSSRCFKIYYSYSMAFNLSNAGKFFCSWNLKDCI